MASVEYIDVLRQQLQPNNLPEKQQKEFDTQLNLIITEMAQLLDHEDKIQTIMSMKFSSPQEFSDWQSKVVPYVCSTDRLTQVTGQVMLRILSLYIDKKKKDDPDWIN